MKIAVVGAGSTYTPELIEGLLARLDVLGVSEIRLQDIDGDRLRVVAGLAERMVNRVAPGVRVIATLSLPEALSDTSFVVIQLRVGGQSARIRDEQVPTGFGLLGQETTGIGGFVKALRTVPVVRAIAREVRLHARPDAWILAFTNPVGIVTRALLEDGHRAVGLCNVAISFQRLFARLLGTTPQAVTLDHAGLNHLTWTRSVRVNGEERIGQLLQSPLRETVASEIGLTPVALDVLGAVPSYYLKYFYNTAEMVRQQRDRPRGMEVLDIERRLLDMYADTSLDHKPALLEERGGAFYSEAAAALITSLHTDDGARHYLDVRNDCAFAGLPGNAVVEVPAIVGRDGPVPERVLPLPPEALSLVQTITAYEELTLEAARTGDRAVAARALLAHPLVPELEDVPRLLDAVLDASRHELPLFFAQR